MNLESHEECTLTISSGHGYTHTSNGSRQSPDVNRVLIQASHEKKVCHSMQATYGCTCEATGKGSKHHKANSPDSRWCDDTSHMAIMTISLSLCVRYQERSIGQRFEIFMADIR